MIMIMNIELNQHVNLFTMLIWYLDTDLSMMQQ